ncbi:large ribosomal subunit protein uL22c-like [Gastrolobium bilobum]|uniref:large ribosomal subunit protein uL22c-like n=1 Tax=Gastrolobium bilobum TaxID=150636 RepID=UPI002AB30173|nr:large ribosomal subunit protein uL22c-like [Gastrolobium bilobum]
MALSSFVVNRPPLLRLHENLPLPFAPQSQTQPKLKFPSVGIRCSSSTFNDKTLISLTTQTSTHNNHPLLCRARSSKFPGQESNKSYVEAYAIGRHIRMSASKARRVVEQIRGRKYDETLMILELMPYRACEAILPIVFSAGANASNNLGLSKASLIISKAVVDEGRTMKRMRPCARGRAHQILKRSCHITIAVKGLPSEAVVEANPA